MKVVGLLLVVGVGAEIHSWASWKKQFGKSYNGVDDESHRYSVFNNNVNYMTASNAKPGVSYTLGTNQFSDLTTEEYNLYKCTCDAPRPPSDIARHKVLNSAVKLPDSLDWTTEGVVTPVKDQGSCGSCWTFSDTGAMESASAVYLNEHVILSEQQLVSCNSEDGCGGGGITSGFKYAETTGMCTEESYGYLATSAPCTLSDGCDVGLPAGKVTGLVNVEVGSEDALLSALNLQPVSVGVNASSKEFHHYASGILDADACGSNHNHAILAVGYGSENGIDYFRIKNSWATTWGDSGFIRLARGKSGLGQCGVLSEPSYPVMASSIAV